MSGSGYIPLFSSLTSGTLCGIWPDVGLWPIVLSLSDKFGVVDVTPMYLSKVTGLPETDVIACMRRFCEPDPYSRTGTERGARLILIDSQRDWGWKIVNHGFYREKARKHMQQLDATASGRDADRKRVERERVASAVPPCPARSGANRPSDSDADPDANTNTDPQEGEGDGRGKPRAGRSAATRLPVDFELTEERRAFAEAEGLDPDRTFANFRDYWTAASGDAKARKCDWAATWQVWCRRDGKGSKKPPRVAKTREALELEELEREREAAPSEGVHSTQSVAVEAPTSRLEPRSERKSDDSEKAAAALDHIRRTTRRGHSPNTSRPRPAAP